MFLYVKLQKVLYGCLKSALIFDDRMVSGLNSRGFIFNPYDQCIPNMTINGNQMIITWHFNNLKILHVDANKVKKEIQS